MILCNYCGKNFAIDEFGYKTEIYKVVSKKTFPKKEISFLKKELLVPRCKNCNDIHSSGSLIFILLPLFSFGIMGLVLGLTIWKYWFFTLIGGALVGLIIGAIFYQIDMFLILKEEGIKDVNNFFKNPLFNHLKNDGWDTNKPTL